MSAPSQAAAEAPDPAPAHAPGRRLVFISLDQVERWIQSLGPRLRAERLDLILGIARGGAIPAVLASFATDLPVRFLRYDRAEDRVGWLEPADPGPPLAGRRVLLCEDIAGQGLTFQRCRDWLMTEGAEVVTLALVHDEHSRIRPDYGWDLTGARAVMPWERHTLHAEYARDYVAERQAGQAAAPDRAYDRWGFDLDGIFLPDLPAALYESRLDLALSLRGALLPFEPRLTMPPGSILITGRPESDRDRTQAWLNRHGFGGIPLFMRDPQSCPIGGPPAFKAAEIRRHGLTHYVESELWQVVEIAARVPEALIHHYDPATRGLRLISALPAQLP